MAYSDECWESMEDARGALDAFLGLCDHDGALFVRLAYGNLRDWLANRDGQEEETTEAAERGKQAGPVEHRDDNSARRRVWKETPEDRRETLVLQALGNEQLTIREVMARVNFELGATDDGSRFVCEGDVRRVVMRMFDGGQLERAKEVFRNKPRFRYFRITRLDGPIAELERAYHDGEVA